MLAGNLIIIQSGNTMSQQMASFPDNGDENKGKTNKDSLRFVCKTKVPHENIVFNFNSDQSKMIVALENSTNEGQFFEGSFSIEDLPDAFKYFDTVFHLLQDMKPKIQRKQATLELTSLSEDLQMLKVRMRMYKQILLLDLRLQKKFASQIAKQTRNLKLLLKQQKQQEQKLKNVQERQKELDNQKDLLEKQLAMIKKQKVTLLQNVNKQLKQQLQEEAKERTIMSQVMIKREQIMELYCKLVQKGYHFTQKQSDLRKKLIGASAQKKGKKKLYQESSSQGSSLQQNLAKVIKPTQKIKDKIAFYPRHSLPKQETINQIIVINSETENLNEAADDIQEIDLKDQINHAAFEQANESINRLQLNEVDSNKEQGQIQQVAPDPIPPPEEKQPQIQKDQTIQNKKGEHSQLPKEQNVFRPRRIEGIVVLSSQQIQIADRMEKQFGRKVKVDFSASQNFSKYQCQYSQGWLQIQKTFEDRLIYHIYHKQPIRDFQSMQFMISRLQKRDLNFGIMRKESLKASRLSWSPKGSICWVGCSSIIFPDSSTKVEQLSQSVNVIVSVDTTNKVIRFKIGENEIHERSIPDEIIRQCYFFVETSTKGNKISFKN